MFDVKELLRKQSEWQRSRRLLPWPEKLRMALVMREASLQLRKRAPEAEIERESGATPPSDDRARSE